MREGNVFIGVYPIMGGTPVPVLSLFSDLRSFLGSIPLGGTGVTAPPPPIQYKRVSNGRYASCDHSAGLSCVIILKIEILQVLVLK